MLGTIANALAIVVGSAVGLFFGRHISDRYIDTIVKALALAIIALGMGDGLQTKAVLLLIVSLAVGSMMGEFIDIEGNLEKLGKWVEKKLGGQEGGIAKGFVTASLLFCVGAMAIMGALEGGLTGDHKTLFVKSILDGIISVAFASKMGVGVLFSALPVFLYQGFIALTASYAKVLLVPEVVREMAAIGGLLVAGIGFNMLEIKRIKVGNMLPAIFIPCIYYLGKLLYLRWMH